MVDDLYVYGKQGFGSTGSEGERKGLQGGGGECEGSCIRANPRLVSLFVVYCFVDRI